MSTMSTLGIEIDPALEAALREQMVGVEAMLREAVTWPDEFVSEAAAHLMFAGGKRFRPLVTLLAAQFGDPAAPGVVPSAVVVELIHLATLYHDDVMDEADVRRGAVSANSRWGNTVAILTGDILFARASQILADLGPDAVRLQAETFERLVYGQMCETVGPSATEDPVEHYLRVITDKTGSLIGTAARFGGMLSAAPADTTDRLTHWGERIGVAFQLADDLLDVAADQAELGKTPGTDLREGVPTLPALLLRRAARPEDRALIAALDDDLSRDDALHQVLTELRANPVMDEARAVTLRVASEAQATLTELPDTPARAALESLGAFVVDRTS
jgi:heptaprenyl diphosphate synthase